MVNKYILHEKNFGLKEIINKFLIFFIDILIKFKRKFLYYEISKSQIVGFNNDHITNILNYDGLYERKELLTFLEFLKKLKPNYKCLNFIDVGANIGNHSIFLSKYFKKVYAIEANIISFNVLKLNVKDIKNIKVFNCAATNKNTNVYLRNKPNNISGSNIEKKNQKKFIKVKGRSLDSLFKNQKNISLIKIDVEGHEYEVIKGARNIILKNNPIIIFEHHLQNFKNNQSFTVNFLKKNGYKKFALIKPFYMISIHDNIAQRIIKNIKQLLLLRMKYIVEINTNLKPDYYAFVIAIPEKFDISK